MTKIKIGLVDDHKLILQSLSVLINNYNEFEVTLTALNGKDLQDKFKKTKKLPDILLIDVNMPIMNGIETAYWVKKQYPSIKLVALTMDDSSNSIVEMMKAGCIAYILKDSSPEDLQKAILEVGEKGYHNSDFVNNHLRRMLLAEKETEVIELSKSEIDFLRLICSDFTYKEIALAMKVTERNIEYYRTALFQKFNVQSRVGLVLEAIKKGFVNLDNI